MKTISFSICILWWALLSIPLAYAQTLPPIPHDQSAQSRAEALVGTWEGKQGAETLRLVFVRNKEFKLADDIVLDVILGSHVLLRNGEVVQQSTLDGCNTGILIGIIKTVKSNFGESEGTPQEPGPSFELSYYERKRDKLGRAIITPILDKPGKMHWVLKEPTEEVKINKPYYICFTIPMDLTLERVQ